MKVYAQVFSNREEALKALKANNFVGHVCWDFVTCVWYISNHTKYCHCELCKTLSNIGTWI